MPKIALKAGAELDVLSQGELEQTLARDLARREIARLRGIKHMRLPLLIGFAAAGKLSLGVEHGGTSVGPQEGYRWAITRLVVTGLASGASPDVVNFYLNSAAGPVFWTLTGNQYAQTFGKGQLTMYGGDTLAVASSGTFSSASQIIVSGEAWETPAELFGKLG